MNVCGLVTANPRRLPLCVISLGVSDVRGCPDSHERTDCGNGEINVLAVKLVVALFANSYSLASRHFRLEFS